MEEKGYLTRTPDERAASLSWIARIMIWCIFLNSKHNARSSSTVSSLLIKSPASALPVPLIGEAVPACEERAGAASPMSGTGRADAELLNSRSPYSAGGWCCEERAGAASPISGTGRADQSHIPWQDPSGRYPCRCCGRDSQGYARAARLLHQIRRRPVFHGSPG